MEIWLAATVQLGSGREAPVPIVGARQGRVGALRGSIEQMPSSAPVSDNWTMSERAWDYVGSDDFRHTP